MDPDPVGDIFPQDSDYDGAWKEALRLHLTDFLATFFPAVHAVIDWSCPLEWCDKELSQILGQAGSRNKRVDLLAKVSLRSGQPQWILLHLEIQSASEPEFAHGSPGTTAACFGPSTSGSSRWWCWPTWPPIGVPAKIGLSWPTLRAA